MYALYRTIVEFHSYIKDGGKIDAWRLCDGVNTFTLCDSGCGITCMTLKGLWLYCGRTNGSIQVWNIESRYKGIGSLIRP